MQDGSPQIGEAAQSEAPREEVWLLGQPPLRDYLRFVRDMVPGGDDGDRRAICDEWRAANDHYHQLETAEAGVADQVECRALDPEMAALAEEVATDPRFRRTFDTVPTSFGMVELDKLVVFQRHVARDYVRQLQTRLGLNPDPASLFRFCLPLAPDNASIRTTRLGSRRYAFTSDSYELRFHDAALLGAEQVEYSSYGPIGAVLGLVVGFGSNFLNVVSADGRMLLHNGYHRAYALRAQGVTHAPAVIQHIVHRDELNVAVTATVADSPAFYFRSPRPPLFKDFFDPKIRKVLAVRRIKRMIEISFEVREFDVAD